MTEFHESQLSSYFELVEKWRDAYKICRLHVLGSRNKNNLEIISARIVLDIGGDTLLKAPFTCRDIEAHQVSIGAEHKDIFSVVRLLAAGKAVEIEGIGHLVLPSTEHTGILYRLQTFCTPKG